MLWKVLLVAGATGLSVWLGYLAPTGQWLPLVAVFGPVFLLLLVTSSLTHLLLLAVVLASFNFTFVLFSGENPGEQPLYLQAVRDVLLLLLLANFMGR